MNTQVPRKTLVVSSLFLLALLTVSALPLAAMAESPQDPLQPLASLPQVTQSHSPRNTGLLVFDYPNVTITLFWTSRAPTNVTVGIAQHGSKTQYMTIPEFSMSTSGPDASYGCSWLGCVVDFSYSDAVFISQYFAVFGISVTSAASLIALLVEAGITGWLLGVLLAIGLALFDWFATQAAAQGIGFWTGFAWAWNPPGYVIGFNPVPWGL